MLSNLHRVSNVALLLVLAMFLSQPGLVVIEAQTCPPPSNATEQCYCSAFANVYYIKNTAFVQNATAGDNVTISCRRTCRCNLQDYWAIQIGENRKIVKQGRSTNIGSVELVPDDESSTCSSPASDSVEEYIIYSLRILRVTTEMDGSIITCGVRSINTSPDQYWYASRSVLLRVGPAITSVTEKGCQNTDIRPVGELVKDVQEGGNVTVTCESTCGADSEKLWLVQMGNNLIALHNDTERLAFREEHGLNISMHHGDINSSLTLVGVRTDLDNLVIRCGQTTNSIEEYPQANYSHFTVVLNVTGGNVSKDELIVTLQQQLSNCTMEVDMRNTTCKQELHTSIGILVALLLPLLIFSLLSLLVAVSCSIHYRKKWRMSIRDQAEQI